jgi:hypothetical protein
MLSNSSTEESLVSHVPFGVQSPANKNIHSANFIDIKTLRIFLKLKLS